MDKNKQKRLQSLRVIISEIIMVLVVILTVIVLALVVSGYWLNSDFKVERQGMLQISSMPTGADVDVDGESSWLQRTNTSKVLSSGEHTITLTKKGYDSWSKTINISDGFLYRVHYPRLFLQQRETQKVLDTTNYSMATISPNNDKLLLINDTTEWAVVNLSNDSLEPQMLDVSKYFSAVSLAEDAQVGLFSGKILDLDWDRGSNHVLFKVKTDDNIEWVLIDTNNVKNSVNLSREFGANFSDVEILDDSSSNLLVVQNQNIHKIDVPGKLISAVLAENVFDFDHYDNEMVFSTCEDDDSQCAVKLIKIGSNDVTELETLSEPAQVTISKFYDEMYIATYQKETVSLFKKTDFEKVFDAELSFAPEDIEVGHDGEFITMRKGTQVATLDMEINAVREWTLEGENFGWIDNDMMYSVSDGELIVYDFDGLNRRVLSKNASSHFPATITSNKWLYYFRDGDLMREWIIQH